ncbi:MAG: hypothetical protein ABEI99_05020, partial [Halobaculum sp.]
MNGSAENDNWLDSSERLFSVLLAAAAVVVVLLVLNLLFSPNFLGPPSGGNPVQVAVESENPGVVSVGIVGNNSTTYTVTVLNSSGVQARTQLNITERQSLSNVVFAGFSPGWYSVVVSTPSHRIERSVRVPSPPEPVSTSPTLNNTTTPTPTPTPNNTTMTMSNNTTTPTPTPTSNNTVQNDLFGQGAATGESIAELVFGRGGLPP